MRKILTRIIDMLRSKFHIFSGLLFDGAFRLRVANGDVDVFIPGPLCLSGKRFDDEQEMWERFPYAVGEDQHDPCNPQPDKDCISRLPLSNLVYRLVFHSLKAIDISSHIPLAFEIFFGEEG